MRTELTLLEKIDLYSSGKLTGDELTNFEQSMASDEVLRSQVETHKNLMRAIKRKALRAQISSVSAAASAGSGLSNLTIGLGSVIGISAIIMATLFFTGNFDEATEEQVHLLDDEIELPVRSLRTEDEIPQVENYKKYVEEPETIFSSHQHYNDQLVSNDDMNVSVRFKSRGEGVKVDPTHTNGSTSVLKTNERDDDHADGSFQTEDYTHKNYSRKAAYPGGNGAMKKFMDKNLYYPKSAEEKAIECVVRCTFHVTEDGLISEIEAECIKMSDKDGVAYNDVKLLMNRRIMNAFIGNATHILRTMPTWEPAKNAEGNPILSVQRMYFNYDLERGCLVYQLDED